MVDKKQQGINTAGEELGKSLAKQLMSEKYEGFTFKDVQLVLQVARNIAKEILEKEELTQTK